MQRNMGEELLNELISLADKKINYLEEMLSITSQQKQAIENEEAETLSYFLGEKDILIQKIDEIDDMFKQKITDVILTNNILEEKLSNIRTILQSIKSIDDENNKNLKRTVEDMSGKLKEVRQGQRAMKGYDGSNPYKAFTAQGGTLFIDQNS